MLNFNAVKYKINLMCSKRKTIIGRIWPKYSALGGTFVTQIPIYKIQQPDLVSTLVAVWEILKSIELDWDPKSEGHGGPSNAKNDAIFEKLFLVSS